MIPRGYECPECGAAKRYWADDDTTLVSCAECGALYYYGERLINA